ncbi:MAG: divalent-cation tolerance protein CutA [Promethearchaeia archaeon]
MNFIFFVTVPSLEEGKNIGREIVEDRLAACVNIIPDLHSIYRWQGVVEEDSEFLLVIKTTEEKAEQLIQKIETIHSYDTPECVGFPIEKGSKKYLDWLARVV